MGKWLIACDIDGTLLYEEMNHPGLKDFNDFIDSKRESIILVLNSGRSLLSIKEAVEEGPIASPDFLICSLGTEIYPDFNPTHKIQDWDARMHDSWQREEISALLNQLPWLEEQQQIHQRPAKLSYYVHDRDNLILKLQTHLGPLIKNIKIIPSHGIYLDIMPDFAGKGEAVKFLARRLGVPSNHVITAGDSGNDLDMLDCGFDSVIVGNHTAELNGYPRKPSIHVSDYPGALGVLDGLVAHHVLREASSDFFRRAKGTEE